MNEIQFAHSATSRPLYAILRNQNGEPWNFGAGAFNTYDNSNLANYALDLSEQAGSRYYVAAMPSVPAGVCFAAFYDKQGSSPVEGDPFVGQQTIDWRGGQTAQLNAVFSQLEQRLPTALVGGRIDASLGDLPGGTTQALADGILDRASGVESGFTLRQGLRLMLAALAGKLSGAGTTTITIRAANDAAGNRSSLFLDAS